MLQKSRVLLLKCRKLSTFLGHISRSRYSNRPDNAVYDAVKEGYETSFVIHDTCKRSKCKLVTKKPNVLTWYSCGPTVYDSAHIGHGSAFIKQDVIRRIMESLNKNLTIIQVMGITDIDDKIINKSNQTGSAWTAVSKHYETEFIQDLSNLNVLPPHIFTRVSDYIPQIISFVATLVKMGFGYPTPDGSVYFDTQKYGDRYGKFRMEDEHLEVTSEFIGDKRNFKDFALWKGSKPGEPYWTTDWGSGKGRPGWHIECSVMATNIFGPYLDLHSGGKDLIFPHHENEEAQCCAHFNSIAWASHWLHTGHLHYKEDVKMSKSLGNTVTIRKFLEEYSPDVLRLMCILAKYRKNIEYSPDMIDYSKKILKKFSTFFADVDAIIMGTKRVNTLHDDGSFWTKLETAKSQLDTALKDDFDTPEALKILIEFISEFNRQHVNVIVEASQNSECNVNYEIVLASRIFVEDFLQLVGLQGFSKGQSQGDTCKNASLESAFSHFVQFRNDVRSYALATDETDKVKRKEKISQRQELLKSCDTIRNQLITEKIEIKDHGKTSSWSHMDA